MIWYYSHPLLASKFCLIVDASFPVGCVVFSAVCTAWNSCLGLLAVLGPMIISANTTCRSVATKVFSVSPPLAAAAERANRILIFVHSGFDVNNALIDVRDVVYIFVVRGWSQVDKELTIFTGTLHCWCLS